MSNSYEKLSEGNATVSKMIVFEEYNTYLPISVSIGDNCCDEHARLAAERVIKMFAGSLYENGESVRVESYS